jgi:hypothetical protein
MMTVDEFDWNPIYSKAECDHAKDGNEHAIGYHDKFGMQGSVC